LITPFFFGDFSFSFAARQIGARELFVFWAGSPFFFSFFLLGEGF